MILSSVIRCGPLISCLAIVACSNISVTTGSVSDSASVNDSSSVTNAVSVSDSGPAEEIDVSSIPEVIPVKEEIVRAGNYSPYTVLGGTYEVMETSRGYREVGIASWYGSKFHGRLTSNGEVYDMFQITAAHKTLPIPAYVLVRNLDNDRELIVRVNDRGPFHDDRIIDLSWAAAAKLGYADNGTAQVEVIALDPEDYQPTLASLAAEDSPQLADIDISSPTEPQQIIEPLQATEPPQEAVYLQVAAFSSLQSARDLIDRLALLTDINMDISFPQAEGGFYRVLAGPIENSNQVDILQTLLELNGLPPGYRVTSELLSAANCVVDSDTANC